MANIREVLILEDQFTAPFTRYITLTQQAAGGTSQAQAAVSRLASQQDLAAKSTNTLMSAVKGLVGAYAGIKAVTKLAEMSDAMTTTTARLDLMNDGLQTTEELTDMIFESANRARGSYTETAAMVSKLGTLAGDAFDSSAEIVSFVEQINKQMAISGTSTAEAKGAMLQLTQAMSSGVLRGEELNSVMEQTPMIAQTIAEYLGVSTGEMRELAAEGKITADIVKSAMLDPDSVEAANKAFEDMPMTWGQVWQLFQNYALKALEPVLNGISWLANNIEIVGPLVLGLGASFAVFQVAANWTKIAAAATGIYNAAVNFLSIGFGVLTGSTAAASAAVFQFNSALLASPITWVIMIVLALVGVLYAAVAVFNKLTGSEVSATGILTGAFATAVALAGNLLIGLLNIVISFANFFEHVFENPVDAIKLLFWELAETVLGLILKIGQGIETLINKIPGVEVTFTDGLENLYNTVKENAQEIRDKNGWNDDRKLLEYTDLVDAFQGGYDFGANLFGGGEEYGIGGGSQDEWVPTLESINDSVGSIEKSVNMSQEDVAMLVDMASQRYVNRINLTAQTPIINVNGANTGNTEADRKALADALKKILLEQAAAGSYRSTARIY